MLRIGLVHDKDNRRVHVAQPLRDFQVERHQLLADVDDEEDQVGLEDGRLDLLLDVLGQVVAVDHADPAGVEQLEETRVVLVANLNERADAVSSNTGDIVDDRDPTTCQPVEQRRLPDIRPADNHHLG